MVSRKRPYALKSKKKHTIGAFVYAKNLTVSRFNRAQETRKTEKNDENQKQKPVRSEETATTSASGVDREGGRVCDVTRKGGFRAGSERDRRLVCGAFAEQTSLLLRLKDCRGRSRERQKRRVGGGRRHSQRRMDARDTQCVVADTPWRNCHTRYIDVTRSSAIAE